MGLTFRIIAHTIWQTFFLEIISRERPSYLERKKEKWESDGKLNL